MRHGGTVVNVARGAAGGSFSLWVYSYFYINIQAIMLSTRGRATRLPIGRIPIAFGVSVN